MTPSLSTVPTVPPMRYFPAIDVLRGFAATMVLIFHVVNHWPGFPNTGWRLFFHYGWAGVDLFFVISGFVITHSALASQAREGAGFWRSFLQRRCARIVPLYMLTGLIFMLLVQPALVQTLDSTLLLRVLGHVFFVQNLHPLTHGALNGPSWTTAVEMQFYLLMVLIAPRLLRWHWGQFLAASVLLGVSYRCALVWWLPSGRADVWLEFIYSTQLPGMWETFAMGITLALLVRAPLGRANRWLQPNLRHCVAWALVAVLVFAAALWVAGDRGVFSTPMLIFWRPLLGLGCAALLCSAITLPHHSHWAWRPLRYWGDISYGIYLWHFLVITALLGLAVPPTGRHLLWQVALWTLLLAIAGWHLVEQPPIARFKKSNSKPKPNGQPHINPAP